MSTVVLSRGVMRGVMLAPARVAGYVRRMPFLSHEGVSLRYDRAGSGPAVLLVHGWAANRTFWDRQVQALRDRHTVITVDLRGHGESSHPRTGYGIHALAGDLEHLVRALGVPRIAVVGWSMGGLVSLALAGRLGERLSALGLVCSTAGGLTDPKNPQAQPERAAAMQEAVEKDFRAFARDFIPNLFRAGSESPLFAWALAQIQKTPPHVAAACLEALMKADLRKGLGAITAPTTVFLGRHDALLPVAAGEALAKAIPGAKLVIFEDSGHAPPLEEPEAFNAALASLLDAHGKAAPEAPKAAKAATGGKRAAATPRAGRSAPSAPSGRGRPKTSK